jgi:hypothetical protein
MYILCYYAHVMYCKMHCIYEIKLILNRFWNNQLNYEHVMCWHAYLSFIIWINLFVCTVCVFLMLFELWIYYFLVMYINLNYVLIMSVLPSCAIICRILDKMWKIISRLCTFYVSNLLIMVILYIAQFNLSSGYDNFLLWLSYLTLLWIRNEL